MARICSVCSHKDRNKIDSLLTTRSVSIDKIAKRFSLSTAALNRHMRNGHLSQKVAKAVEAKEIAEADTLLDQVKSLSARALSILNQAEGAGDLRTACSAIREVRGTLELLAKVTGELKPDQPVINIGILIEPDKIIGTAAYREYEERVYAELTDQS